MSTKHKCRECVCASIWATPSYVNEGNYEYAKHVLDALNRSICCTERGKTRLLNQEIYCKDFRKTDEYGWSAERFEKSRQVQVKELEQKIKNYEERTKGNEQLS